MTEQSKSQLKRIAIQKGGVMTEQIPEDVIADEKDFNAFGNMVRYWISAVAANGSRGTAAILEIEFAAKALLSIQLQRQREHKEQVSEAVATLEFQQDDHSYSSVVSTLDRLKAQYGEGVRIKLYTSQPQPQSVREAYEKAAAICEAWATTADNYGFDGDAIDYRLIKHEILTLIPPLSKDDQ